MELSTYSYAKFNARSAHFCKQKMPMQYFLLMILLIVDDENLLDITAIWELAFWGHFY